MSSNFDLLLPERDRCYRMMSFLWNSYDPIIDATIIALTYLFLHPSVSFPSSRLFILKCGLLSFKIPSSTFLTFLLFSKYVFFFSLYILLFCFSRSKEMNTVQISSLLGCLGGGDSSEICAEMIDMSICFYFLIFHPLYRSFIFFFPLYF